MKSLLNKDLLEKKNTVVLVNKVNIPKEFYEDMEVASLSFNIKIRM